MNGSKQCKLKNMNPLLLDRSCLIEKISKLSPAIDKLEWINQNDALFRAYWSYYASNCKRRQEDIRRRIEQNSDLVQHIRDKTAASIPKDPQTGRENQEKEVDIIYDEILECFRSKDGKKSATTSKMKDQKLYKEYLSLKCEEDIDVDKLKRTRNPYDIEQIKQKLNRLQQLKALFQPTPYPDSLFESSKQYEEPNQYEEPVRKRWRKSVKLINLIRDVPKIIENSRSKVPKNSIIKKNVNEVKKVNPPSNNLNKVKHITISEPKKHTKMEVSEGDSNQQEELKINPKNIIGKELLRHLENKAGMHLVKYQKRYKIPNKAGEQEDSIQNPKSDFKLKSPKIRTKFVTKPSIQTIERAFNKQHKYRTPIEPVPKEKTPVKPIKSRVQRTQAQLEKYHKEWLQYKKPIEPVQNEPSRSNPIKSIHQGTRNISKPANKKPIEPVQNEESPLKAIKSSIQTHPETHRRTRSKSKPAYKKPIEPLSRPIKSNIQTHPEKHRRPRNVSKPAYKKPSEPVQNEASLVKPIESGIPAHSAKQRRTRNISKPSIKDDFSQDRKHRIRNLPYVKYPNKWLKYGYNRKKPNETVLKRPKSRLKNKHRNQKRNQTEEEIEEEDSPKYEILNVNNIQIRDQKQFRNRHNYESPEKIQSHDAYQKPNIDNFFSNVDMSRDVSAEGIVTIAPFEIENLLQRKPKFQKETPKSESKRKAKNKFKRNRQSLAKVAESGSSQKAKESNLSGGPKEKQTREQLIERKLKTISPYITQYRRFSSKRKSSHRMVEAAQNPLQSDEDSLFSITNNGQRDSMKSPTARKSIESPPKVEKLRSISNNKLNKNIKTSREQSQGSSASSHFDSSVKGKTAFEKYHQSRINYKTNQNENKATHSSSESVKKRKELSHQKRHRKSIDLLPSVSRKGRKSQASNDESERCSFRYDKIPTKRKLQPAGLLEKLENRGKTESLDSDNSSIMKADAATELHSVSTKKPIKAENLLEVKLKDLHKWDMAFKSSDKLVKPSKAGKILKSSSGFRESHYKPYSFDKDSSDKNNKHRHTLDAIQLFEQGYATIRKEVENRLHYTHRQKMNISPDTSALDHGYKGVLRKPFDYAYLSEIDLQTTNMRESPGPLRIKQILPEIIKSPKMEQIYRELYPQLFMFIETDDELVPRAPTPIPVVEKPEPEQKESAKSLKDAPFKSSATEECSICKHLRRRPSKPTHLYMLQMQRQRKKIELSHYYREMKLKDCLREKQKI